LNSEVVKDEATCNFADDTKKEDKRRETPVERVHDRLGTRLAAKLIIMIEARTRR
jgi:hypothetical protein